MQLCCKEGITITRMPLFRSKSCVRKEVRKELKSLTILKMIQRNLFLSRYKISSAINPLVRVKLNLLR